MLFQISGEKLKAVKAKPFTLEKDLQRLVEENLGELFGLKFLATEFPIDRFRFDTVAYDGENDAFIIIEYKRGRNESLVDQGYAYLNTVLDRKAELVLLYNEVTGAAKLMKDFDWAATRVYFVSPAFTDYQKRATGYQKMPFRLFEVSRYANGAVTVEEINERKLADDPAALSQNREAKTVSRQVVVYTEEDHLTRTGDALRELYGLFKERIAALGDVQAEAKKVYVAFKRGKNNVCDVEVFRGALKITINMREGTLEDPRGAARLVKGIGHHGNGDYVFSLSREEDLDYLMTLLRQSYRDAE